MPGPLEGKIIVFTGTLAMKRAEAKEKAEGCGATVAGSVSGKTNILVLGEGAGQKAAAAAAKGIDVWTEEQFVDAVSGKGGKAAKAQPKAAKKGGKASGGDGGADEPGLTTATAPKPPPKRKGGKAAKEESEEEIEEEAPKPAKRGAKKAAAQPEPEVEKPKPAPAKKGRGAKTPVAEEESTKEEEPEPPKETKKRGAAKSEEGTKRGAKKAAPEKTESAEKTESGDGGGAAASGGPRARKPDRLVPNASNLTVYEDYDVKLMFTDIGSSAIGNNKFYIIQVLEGQGKYWAWNRWGRLGENGQNALQEFSNVADAIKSFEKKFQDKTKNKWANRDAFVRHADKYQLVETEEDEGGGDGDGALGRLSVAQINKGKKVLDEIKDALENKRGNAGLFTKLSSDFYSLIPTASGRKAPEKIDNMETLQAKESLLEFWLRMGFDDMKEEEGVTPVHGVLALPVPPDLKTAAAGISDAGSISSSTTKGKSLAASGAGKPVKPMDQELYGAILLYTGNSIYAELNRVLRSENRKAVLKYFKYLRLFLEAMECMPKQSRTLWRGVSVDLYDQYQEGRTITWWGVSSCTSDQNVAEAFMRSCGGNCTLLTIECKTAMDISALSFYSSEKESLLAPGTQLQVLSRTRDGKIAKIHLAEVGRALS